MRSIFQAGASRKLEEELLKYQIDVAALQEIRWKTIEVTELQHYILFNSGEEENRIGTGFIVKKSVSHNVIEYEAISPRHCRLRLKGRFANISLISVHAPTEDAEEEEKEQFYEKMEQAYDKLPKYDVKVVLGDYNAKVGKEKENHPVVGYHSKHQESNENGWKLIDFAFSKEMVIKSTCFPHKEIHKETWISPDGRTKNQIDHVLIDARHASNIMDVRSMRGADIDSDHILVRIKFQERLAVKPKERAEQSKIYNVELLKDEKKEEEYRDQLQRKLRMDRNGQMDINTMWEETKLAINMTAQEVLGERKKQNRNKWYDEEVSKILEERNMARQRMLQRPTRNNIAVFKEKRSIAKTLIRNKKRKEERERVDDMQKNFENKQGRKFFHGVGQVKKGYQPRVNILKDETNRLIVGKERILEKWAEHFETLLSVRLINEEREGQDGMETTERNEAGEDGDEWEEEEMNEGNGEEDEEDMGSPPIEEIREIIKQLKNSKAPGNDRITAEMVKHGGEVLVRRIHEIIKKAWETGEMPEDWTLANICPIHKKGSRMLCKNYRGISLLSIVYKILSTAITKRVSSRAERIIGEYQAGFRPGRSTMDHIFTMRMTLEKTYEYNVRLGHLFIDFKQAYDRVKRSTLWETMKEFKFPQKLIKLTKMTLENSRSQVKVQGSLSRSFRTEEGLRQGDPLSPVLFNLVLEKAVRSITTNPGGNIYNRLIQVLAYADDVVISARSNEALTTALRELKDAAGSLGLEISEAKSKYMVTERNGRNTGKLQVDDYTFEAVDSFTYLGAVITSENKVETDIVNRIKAANRSYRALYPLLRSKNLSRKLKLTLYKTIIKPVLMYGSEAWVMTETTEKRLNVWERKVLRKIFGPVKEGDLWRIRTNEEIRLLYNEPDLVTSVKMRRIGWLGHVQRMEEERLPRKALTEHPGGRRRRGRPRKRWLEDVEADLRTVGVRRWRRRAEDRDDWRAVVKEAKVLKGP